ncbi:MAG: hypothetical protein ACYCYK_07075 [Candidatus Dormibacteria bacterium]
MAAYEPATVEGLRESVHEISRTVEELKSQIQDKEEWYLRFQDALDRVGRTVAELTNNVDKIQNSLREEIEARKQTSEAVGHLRTGIAVNGNTLLLLGGLVLAVVGGLIGFLLSKL